MEMGSNYMTIEGSSNVNTSSGSPDSINGLKFGQKIYFEDVGIGAPSKSGCGSPAPAKKGGKTVVQNGQPPRCQVEGCKVDLSDAKPYYSRHKVCGMHSKSRVVIVAGLEQRFCQQCSRFHQLAEFDQGKRSCRRRLAGHNERRRKPPPGSLLSSRLGRLSSSLFGGKTSYHYYSIWDSLSNIVNNIIKMHSFLRYFSQIFADSSSRNGGGFLLDFSSYVRHSEKDMWPGTKPPQQFSECNSTSSAGKYLQNFCPDGCGTKNPPEMYVHGSEGGGSCRFSIPPGECMTGGVSSDSNCALSLLSNNQNWDSTNRASGIIEHSNNLMNVIDGSTSTSTTSGAHSITVAHLPTNNSSSSSSWGCFKQDDPTLHQITPSDHLGLGQISHHGQYHHHPGDLYMYQVQNGERQFMEDDHSRVYNPTANNYVHWSL